jgi:hypothetical protein
MMLVTLLFMMPVMQGSATTHNYSAPPQWETPILYSWDNEPDWYGSTTHRFAEARRLREAKPIEVNSEGNYTAWREAGMKTNSAITNRETIEATSSFRFDHRAMFSPDRSKERWTVLPDLEQLTRFNSDRNSIRHVFSFESAPIHY